MVVLKGFSAHVGANEKYKGGILKYVPCILKYVRLFFGGSFGGVLNAEKHVASARLLMSVPVCLVFSSVLFFVVRRPGCVFFVFFP